MNILDIVQSRAWFGREFGQLRVFNNAEGLPEFIGIAERARPTSSPGWTIVQLSYDVNNMFSTELSAPRNSILDDREDLIYA